MVFSHLNPADHHSARITKTNKDFAKIPTGLVFWL